MYSFIPLTETKVVIFAHIGEQALPGIRKQLVNYKSRWNESIASNLLVVYSVTDIPSGIPVIVAEYQSSLITSMSNELITVPSLSQLTHYHLRRAVVSVNVQYTEDPIEAQTYLTSLAKEFTFDTETASIVSLEDEQRLTKELSILDPNNLAETQPIRSQLASNALVMTKNQTTMYSFADSESSAYVISSNSETDKVVLDFLTTTSSLVIMHNALYDMRLVYNRTGKFIKNFEDTQLMYATILNNTNTFLAKVGLKGLAGKIYGDWAQSPDLFGIEHKFNPDLIHYSGVDAAATMFIYNEAKLQLEL